MSRRLLIDARILIRFAMVDDPDHLRVVGKLEALVEEGWELCFAPQAVREAWNALTRPSANGGYGVAPEKVEETLSGAWTAFVFLDEIPAVFREWRRLAAAYGLVGKSVHDANVVATALAHGITHVLTLNERDFGRYTEIETIVPRALPVE